ncbi:MAG TPA: methylated-DNA--[protein]-cysteine S-methyltransferase [Ktedonobacterales bacterium]
MGTDHGDAMARGTVTTWAGATRVAASAAGVRGVWLPGWRGSDEAAVAAIGPRPWDGSRVEIAIQQGGAGEGSAERHLRQALAELGEFFAGTRREFTVALDPQGPAFFAEVWAAVTAVPYGETRAYGEIARVVGQPEAPRAVGAANGANPVAPFVPCHRIVGSDGRLTGYGPGLPLKRLLLRMEDAIPGGPDDYEAWIARVTERRGGKLVLGVRPTRTACDPDCAVARRHLDRPARFFHKTDEALAAGFARCGVCGAGQATVSAAAAGLWGAAAG